MQFEFAVEQPSPYRTVESLKPRTIFLLQNRPYLKFSDTGQYTCLDLVTFKAKSLKAYKVQPCGVLCMEVKR